MIQLTFPDYATDTSLLLIRIVLSLSFVIAARNKAKNLRRFAKNNGLLLPIAFVVMCIELASGLALLLGIAAQFAALAIMLLMLGTMRLHIFKWKSPYWASKGGWEYDLMLFTMASVIAIYGAGQFSL